MRHIRQQKSCIILKALIFQLLLLITHNAYAPSGDHWETVVMSNDIWSYLVASSEPSSSWNELTFNDSAWSKGKGGIGYGDGDDSTIITPPVVSVYMRIRFNVIDIDEITELFLNVDFDDGFVAYLNGYEVARANIGTEGVRPAWNEFAILTSYEAVMPAGRTPAGFYINREKVRSCLHNGSNVLALQVHNASSASSDLSSTTFLSAGISSSVSRYRPLPAWFRPPDNGYTHLPVIAIETQGAAISNEPKISAWMKVINSGDGKLNSHIQDGTDYDGPVGVEIRGQSSQSFPKKSYSVEIRGIAGADSTASLLGMPEAEDWALHAHYSDKSMLRNALTFHLGSRLGGWQPRFRYCVVYINGEYNGIYLLMENIKKGEKRVDISTLTPDERSGDDITGGYILKVDKTGGIAASDYFTSYPVPLFSNARNYKFTYVYPAPEIISPNQRSYIAGYILGFQNNLNSSIFADPLNGYSKFIDPQSFIDFQVIQELSNNVDGYRYSTFFYKKKDSKGGKLYAGPLWDFDLCFGNVNFSPASLSTSGWLYTRYGPAESNCMYWWYRLMQDPAYSRRFVLRWRELRSGAFVTDSIMSYIDGVVNYLGNEVDRNYARWPVLGKYVWPNSFVGTTYLEEVEWLKQWISERLEWIDMNTGLKSEAWEDGFGRNATLFPNPVKDVMTIVFYLPGLSDAILEFSDVTGRLLKSVIYTPATNGYQEFSTATDFLPGGYSILRIRQSGRPAGTVKILKY